MLDRIQDERLFAVGNHRLKRTDSLTYNDRLSAGDRDTGSELREEVGVDYKTRSLSPRQRLVGVSVGLREGKQMVHLASEEAHRGSLPLIGSVARLLTK